MKDHKALITKSNDLNEARYKLNTSEQRIILYMISMIQPTDEDFKIYKIKTSDLLNLIGIKNQQLYTELRRITKGLLEKVLEIRDGDRFIQVSWFSSVVHNNRKGYMEVEFSPRLKPYLLQLKEFFVSYRLKNVIQLKSSYSIRMYELLKQYERIGSRIFELEDLKLILGINESEYKLYKHFKSRIILPAQREIPQKTDIRFDFKEIKTGRKVTAIEFLIYSKPKPEPESGDIVVERKRSPDDEISSLVALLPEKHRDKKTILEAIARACQKHGDEYAARNIKYTNQNCTGNYRAYLNKALKEDWGVAVQEDEEVSRKLEEKNRAVLEERKREDERKAEQEAKEQEALTALYNTLTPEERDVVDKRVESNLNSFEKDMLRRYRASDMEMSDLLKASIERERRSVLKEIALLDLNPNS